MDSIIGPPGTGKTYALEQKIKDSRGNYIYLTYNRSMADHARKRIVDDPKHIGTFHSILSRHFGLFAGKDGDFLTMDDEKEFCRRMGITYLPDRNEEGYQPHTDWEKFREWYDYVENAQVQPYQPMGETLAMLTLYDKYRGYKESLDKMDYTDILLRGTSHPLPWVESLYVDESQDLTKLMWNVIDLWPADNKIIALDDEQSLYDYKGVSDNTTLAHVQNPVILQSCRRYGEPVKRVAENIIRPVRKINRDYDAVGESETGHNDLRMFLSLQGSRAILCRTNYLAREIARIIDVPVKPINPEHGLGTGWTPVTYEMHSIFSKYPRLNKEEWESVIKRTPAGIWMRGTKTGAQHGKLTLEYYERMQKGNAESLISMLNVTDKQKRNIIQYMGTDLSPMFVDTVHAAKGLEFDHVMIATDKPLELVFTPGERRVLYVATTRAKQSLDFHYFDVYADDYEMWRFFN